MEGFYGFLSAALHSMIQIMLIPLIAPSFNFHYILDYNQRRFVI